MPQPRKTVYLVTRRAGYNFGSSLQAYALQRVIEAMGFRCEILNVREMRLRGRLRVLALNVAGFCLARLPLLRRVVGCGRWQRLTQSYAARRKFDRFNTRTLHVSSRALPTPRSLARHVAPGSPIVCGSDQIWSPLGFSPVMFLSFADPSRNRLVAYAPSFGVAEVKDHYADIRRLVLRFHHLSAREQSGRRVLEAMTGRPVDVVLDPTLLLPAAAWGDVEQSMPLPPGGYVVSYFLSTDRFPEAFIRELAAREGLPVVNVQTNYSHIHMPGADNRADLGPGEFLHLLRHATYVCTNSFHCCIFSHRFGRQYYVFSRFASDDPANQNTRIETLLEIFGERHRWMTGADTPPPQAAAASQEEELRRKSLDYLNRALGD